MGGSALMSLYRVAGEMRIRSPLLDQICSCVCEVGREFFCEMGGWFCVGKRKENLFASL